MVPVRWKPFWACLALSGEEKRRQLSTKGPRYNASLKVSNATSINVEERNLSALSVKQSPPKPGSQTESICSMPYGRRDIFTQTKRMFGTDLDRHADDLQLFDHDRKDRGSGLPSRRHRPASSRVANEWWLSSSFTRCLNSLAFLTFISSNSRRLKNCEFGTFKYRKPAGLPIFRQRLETLGLTLGRTEVCRTS